MHLRLPADWVAQMSSCLRSVKQTDVPAILGGIPSIPFPRVFFFIHAAIEIYRRLLPASLERRSDAPAPLLFRPYPNRRLLPFLSCAINAIPSSFAEGGRSSTRRGTSAWP